MFVCGHRGRLQYVWPVLRAQCQMHSASAAAGAPFNKKQSDE